MSRIDLRIKYHHDTGKYPVDGMADSILSDFGEDQECEISTYDEKGEPATIENPLYPLLDYIAWLEEQLDKQETERK